MDRPGRLLVGSLVALLGAVGFLALTVSPFDYGPVESAVLVGLLVLAVLFETVLDDAPV